MPQAARLGDPIGHTPPGDGPKASGGGDKTGKIIGPCSGNVFTNGIKAARAHVDETVCSKHNQAPPPIATGSPKVFINGLPAARVSDKIACGAFIIEGSPNVFIGGGGVQTDPIMPEGTISPEVELALTVAQAGAAAILKVPIGNLLALIPRKALSDTLASGLSNLPQALKPDALYAIGGGYDPQDLREAGYPEDARFIEQPTGKDGRLIEGTGAAKKDRPDYDPNALSRQTYPLGSEADEKLSKLMAQVDKKVPKNNSPALITEIQTSLGMEGKKVTGFLDTNTYRAMRDWKVDIEDKRTRGIADTLMTQSIRPALKDVGLSSTSMENLLLGTAIHESGDFQHRKQAPGPALSLFQIEPDTANFYMEKLKKSDAEMYKKLSAMGSGNMKADLAGNDKFAAAMAAVIYDDRLDSRNMKMPAGDDVRGLGGVWKKLYNTSAGKGTVEQYVSEWNDVFKKK
ncbi:PAAR domain-containing protein [Massilia rubra]|uniref:Uncharacterized protein n=1 Tax=Massilia rubra TaxID=2607910 RepID=A0ABX0LUH5_9BURK|nr:PAAR domain-containing protein [Massilia rubra]NHZ35822.1 hypothetical protein [Massilia rubra]